MISKEDGWEKGEGGRRDVDGLREGEGGEEESEGGRDRREGSSPGAPEVTSL